MLSPGDQSHSRLAYNFLGLSISPRMADPTSSLADGGSQPQGPAMAIWTDLPQVQ
jgi:hypothetical protein